MSDQLPHDDPDERGYDDRLVPPGVADRRGRAFARALFETASRIDPDALRIDPLTCDARLLPTLVREAAVHKYMFEGITEELVREFVDRAHELHALEGTLPGIRAALGIVGMTVEWQHWYQMDPPGPVHTYIATVYVDASLADDGDLFGPRALAAASRMIRTAKRHSQDGPFRVGVRMSDTIAAASAAAAIAFERTAGTVVVASHDTDRVACASAACAVALDHDHGTAATPIHERDLVAAASAATALTFDRSYGSVL